MKKVAFVYDGRSYELALDRTGEEANLTTTVDGEAADAIDAKVLVDPPWVIIRTDGTVCKCAVARDNGGIWVSLRGRSVYLETPKAQRGGGGTPKVSDNEVRAPMTGTVLDVKVKAGDQVKTGDLVAVMEAMKMEYRLEATMDGEVVKVECAVGDMLDVGTLMVELQGVD